MRLSLAIGPIAACLLAHLACAQTVVIPNGYASVDANSSTGYPWGYGTQNSTRVQYVYDSTHFTAQAVNYPIVINRLRWRANASTTTAGYVYTNVVVKLSTCPVDHTSITTTFAANHGADLATVYTGSVTVQTPAGTNPNSYYVDIAIQPFLYDPALGDLNVDLACDGTGPTTTTGPAMDCQTTGTMCHRMYNLSNWQATTGSIQANVGPVIEVGFNPANGLYAGFSANTQVGTTPFTVDFTDSSFTSDPGGILAWAWDFDNDGVVDATVQNPSWTFTTCGVYDVALTVFDASHAPDTRLAPGFISTDHTTADFTHSVLVPYLVQFTDTSAGSPTSWAWDFDGDGVTDSTVQHPGWVFSTGAPATVSLTVSRLCGPPSTVQHEVVPVPILSHNMAPNNGLSTGSLVFFDLDVTAPRGLFIESLDTFHSTSNTPFNLDLWVKQGSFDGFEKTPGEWVLAGSAQGTSGATSSTPTPTTFPTPVYLPPGLHGIAIGTDGVGIRYQTGTAFTTVANGDVAMTLGKSLSCAVGSPFVTTSTPISPRWWSGTIYYSTHGATGNAGAGVFGAGCAGSQGISTLAYSGWPVLGATMTVTVDHLPFDAAVLMNGFNNTVSPLGPLPLDISSLGAPGCALRVAPQMNVFLAGSGGTASWALALPNDPGLLGQPLFQQAVVFDPGHNAIGAVGSHAYGLVWGY